MKLKTVMLCSVAVILAASGTAMADPEVYGKVNVTLQNSDEAGASEVELKSNASRFGVKGDEDLGNGLKAIYKFEWEVDPTDESKSSSDHIKSRNQYVGLAGSFGEIKVGRHDTALKEAQGDFDLFNDLEGDIKHTFNGENRESNYIGYTSPKFGEAFSIRVNLYPGEAAGTDNDGVADATSIALTYEANNLYLAVAQDSDVDGTDVDTTRFVGGYKWNDMQFNLLWQNTDVGSADGDGFGASFAYKFGNNTFKLQYLDADIYQTGLASLESQTSIGLDHKFGKNTKLFGFYTAGDIGGTDNSNDYFGIGLEQKF